MIPLWKKLETAIKSGETIDLQQVQHLSAEWANKPLEIELWRAFHWAAITGHASLVEVLLKDARIDLTPEYNAGLFAAVTKGHVETVTALLADNRADPSAKENKAIRLAAWYGHQAIAEILLKDKRVNPGDKDNEAIIRAIKNGHAEVVDLLLSHEDVNPAARDDYVFGMAAIGGHYKVMKKLLADQRVNPGVSNNIAIRTAARYGQLEHLEVLLNHEKTDPSDQNNEAIALAAANGHAKIVERLLQDARVNPADKNNRALLYAIDKGSLEIVQLLLGDSRVEPSDDNNTPLHVAAIHGRLDIVRELLKYETVRQGEIGIETLLTALKNGYPDVVIELLKQPKVDPSLEDNALICVAAEKGYSALVEMLLKDERVDPTAADNYAIRMASVEGHTDVFKLLLEDRRANPSCEENYAIRMAVAKGHIDILEMLLKDERVDPAADNNYAIGKAAAKGHTEIVRMLLKDDRVHPEDDANYAIGAAATEGHTEIIKMLLEDSRVDPADKNNFAIRTAATMGHAEIVKMLLDDGRADPAANTNEAIQKAAYFGKVAVFRSLILSGKVRVTGSDRFYFSNFVFGNYAIPDEIRDEIRDVLAEYDKSPLRLAMALIDANKKVILFESTGITSGDLSESSMDRKLERASDNLQEALKNKYPETNVQETLEALRRDILIRLKNSLPPGDAKDFLTDETIQLLVELEPNKLRESTEHFKSNVDNLHVAWRALNPIAPSVVWANLLTTDDANGHDIQSRAAHIYHAIQQTEDETVREDCMTDLLYSLAEIRRAHNEFSPNGTDNPSCYPGSKTRLARALSKHSDYQHLFPSSLKEDIKQYAQSYFVEKFRAEMNKMSDAGRTREEAQHFLFSVIGLSSETAEDIIAGNPLTLLAGEPYGLAHADERKAFIEEEIDGLEGLRSNVNGMLIDHDKEPILPGDDYEVYLQQALLAIGDEPAGLLDTFSKAFPSNKREESAGTVDVAVETVNPFIKIQDIGLPAQSLPPHQKMMHLGNLKSARQHDLFELLIPDYDYDTLEEVLKKTVKLSNCDKSIDDLEPIVKKALALELKEKEEELAQQSTARRRPGQSTV